MKHHVSRAPEIDDDLPISSLLYLLGSLILMVIAAGAVIFFFVL